MKLYSYWRSTTSFRVRAALNLKGLAYDIVPVNLVKAEQSSPDYAALNPNMAVPTLVLDDGTVLTQSMAILDYLDQIAEPRLTPSDPVRRAHVLAAAHTVAMDIHPVNNLKVLAYLKGTLGHSQNEAVTWMRDWMQRGFDALQVQVAGDTLFCFGDTPDVADLCLTGQMINAHRWGLDLTPYPRLTAIETACLAVPAIAAALPERQPDATN